MNGKAVFGILAGAFLLFAIVKLANLASKAIQSANPQTIEAQQ